MDEGGKRVQFWGAKFRVFKLLKRVIDAHTGHYCAMPLVKFFSIKLPPTGIAVSKL
jgi:hypothetical protein